MVRKLLRKLGVGRACYLMLDPHIRRRRKVLKGTPAAVLPPEQWETIDLLVCARTIKPDIRHIWDVGACTGVWSTVARSLSAHARIDAFEPQERVLDSLRTTLGKLGNGFVHHCALGEADGESIFYETSQPDCSSLLKPQAGVGHDTGVTEVRIQKRAASSIIARGEAPLPDLLKLDVQGYELGVLQGFGEHLRSVPLVLSEVILANWYVRDHDSRDLLKYLFENGFFIASVTSAQVPWERMKSMDVLFVNTTECKLG